MRNIHLIYDDTRFRRLRYLKERLKKRVVWEDFVYNSVTEFFKLQKKEKTKEIKNGKRKKKFKGSSGL